VWEKIDVGMEVLKIFKGRKELFAPANQIRDLDKLIKIYFRSRFSISSAQLYTTISRI